MFVLQSPFTQVSQVSPEEDNQQGFRNPPQKPLKPASLPITMGTAERSTTGDSSSLNPFSPANWISWNAWHEPFRPDIHTEHLILFGRGEAQCFLSVSLNLYVDIVHYKNDTLDQLNFLLFYLSSFSTRIFLFIIVNLLCNNSYCIMKH